MTRVAIRRRVKTGKNLDFIAGYNLLDQSMQGYVRDRIRTHKLLIVIMGYPLGSVRQLEPHECKVSSGIVADKLY